MFFLAENDTYNHSYTESNERVILELDPERDIDNSYLIIEKIDMYDRGVFTCIATSPVTGLELDRSTCMVRVKGTKSTHFQLLFVNRFIL